MENLEKLGDLDYLKNERIVLVPCDFSTLAFQALEHGAFMSKAMGSRLVMLHVAPRESEVSHAARKMLFTAEDCLANFGVKPDVVVRVRSSPYPAIKEVANELDPIGVILKTSGGIRTIEILSGTSIPFLVIQGQPKTEMMHNIVFPINFLQKLDDKMMRVVHFSNHYPEAKMHIITPSGRGVDKERNVSANIALMTKVLKDQHIDVNFITHDNKKNTAESILELAKDMDMVVIQMEESTWLSRLFFGLREEKLMTNEAQIPVLCFKKDSHFK